MVKAGDKLADPSGKLGYNEPWRADAMDDVADVGIDWAAKNIQKSSGSFDVDYEKLCRDQVWAKLFLERGQDCERVVVRRSLGPKGSSVKLYSLQLKFAARVKYLWTLTEIVRQREFEVPAHPCLASRRSTGAAEDAVATLNNPATSTAAASRLSTIQFRNFSVDLMTLHLVMKALKMSSDIKTLTFHNAGLTGASIAILVEQLQHTSVRSLNLDYSLPSCLLTASSASSERQQRLSVEEEQLANEAAPVSSPSRPNIAGLVGEVSKLKALSLRGNGLRDVDAIELAEAIEQNTVLCSLSLFDNKITDNGGAALAKALRLNTVLRGLSLARNSLTSASAEVFGLLLAGGYEVSAAEQEKRAIVDAKIAAQNKIAQDAMKKKKDAKVETRLPLSTVVVRTAEDGSSKAIAGGNRSLVTLNLAENRELGAGGALLRFLSMIAESRREKAGEAGDTGAGGAGSAAGAVVLQELHLEHCQGHVEEEEEEDEEEEEEGGDVDSTVPSGEKAETITSVSLALSPTKVFV